MWVRVSESNSICAGKLWELKGEKDLAAVQTDEDIDYLAVVSPWVQLHERDTLLRNLFYNVTAKKKAG